MKNLEFPIVGTRLHTPTAQAIGGQAKIKNLTEGFDLESPAGRKKYFEAKVGDEIKHIKKFLDKNTFIAYFLGKKSSGKGTYSKLIAEILGEDKIAHVSVGDLVRETDDWKNFVKTDRFARLKRYYRGYVSFDDIVKSLSSRSTEKLLPTEFILALVKAHIDELQGKAIFIDGLPRGMDQISYSLYFRDIANYRDDPDFFVLIDIPESVIDERMKYRVICPKCQTSRNIKLLVTSKIGYDTKSSEFYLVCDNPSCEGARMVRKEGDEKGLEPIRERLNKDEELIRTTFQIHGIPKILLRNHVPVAEALKYFDDYEITPEYSFSRSKDGVIKVHEKSWSVKDDNGVKSNSLLAPPVVVSFIKQLVEVLEI
jgi:adenylate kinase family enzyme